MRSGVVGVVLTATLAFGASPAIAAGTGTGTACSTNCTIYALDGSGQAALVGTAFAAGLAVEVVGAAPSSSVSVTFLAPASGPSGTFAGAGTSATATGTTSSAGTASVTAPPFVANTIAGSYSVYASISTVATPAVFSLTNIGPGAIAAVAGTPASSLIGTTFSTELAVEVTDSSGTAVPGVQVSFAAPSSGPSGEFVGGGAQVTAVTNASGVATAPPFVANGATGGPYTVTASVVGVPTSAQFSLTNTNALSYWLVSSHGAVYDFGDARFYGSFAYHRPAPPIVGIASTPDGKGYWLVSSHGAVYGFGDARFYGSTASRRLGAKVVGIARTPDGKGYWLLGQNGAVYSFGNAGFYGSLAGLLARSRPVTAMIATPGGQGYWLVGANGAVYSFGDAGYSGDAAGFPPGGAVVGVATTAAS